MDETDTEERRGTRPLLSSFDEYLDNPPSCRPWPEARQECPQCRRRGRFYCSDCLVFVGTPDGVDVPTGLRLPLELLSSGTCGCQEYDLTQGDDYKTIMDLLSFVEFFVEGYSEDIQRQVVKQICSAVVNYGEQSQSSSSLDPMFWPMHGTMERLYQFAVVTGTVTEFTWPDEDMTVTLPDGTSYTQYASSYYEECNGHHGSHIFPYGLLGSDIDGFKVKTGIRSNPVTGNNLTNREVLEAFDPRFNSLNYVYDTFKWDHCVPEGYDFDDARAETASSARKNVLERDEPRSAVYRSFKQKMAELMKKGGVGPKEKEEGASNG